MSVMSISFKQLALAAGVALALLAPGAARAQSPEAESVTREAAGDDNPKEGPGKSPTESGADRQKEPSATAVGGAPDGAKHGGHEHGDPSKHFNFFGGPFSHNGKDVAGGPYGDGVNYDPKTGHAAPGEEEPMSAPFNWALHPGDNSLEIAPFNSFGRKGIVSSIRLAY